MKYINLLIGVCVAFSSIYFVFSKIDFASMFQVMGSLHLGWILFSFSLTFLLIFFKSLRWHVLLKIVNKISFRDVFCSFSIGNMMNMLLPFRSGDVIRIVMLSKQKNTAKGPIVGTVVYEHVLDLLALSCILLLPR